MNKKGLIILIIIMTIPLFTINLIPTVKADSGFDTSYGTGGGWSGGSYSDRSGSFRDSSRSLGGSSGGLETLIPEPLRPYIVIAFIIAAVSFFLYNIIKMITKLTTIIPKVTNEIKEDSEEIKKENKIDGLPLPTKFDVEIIKKEIKDFKEEEFLQEAYDLYLKVQEDWENFNYEGLRKKLTDELYNQYEMQLELLKMNHQKNIIKNIELISSRITDYKKENNTNEITINMTVSLIDYIEEDGEVVKGSKIKRIKQLYNLSFIKNDKTIDKCPNCGKKIEEKSTQKCESCGSIIPNINSDWVLSKKQSIRTI